MGRWEGEQDDDDDKWACLANGSSNGVHTHARTSLSPPPPPYAAARDDDGDGLGIGMDFSPPPLSRTDRARSRLAFPVISSCLAFPEFPPLLRGATPIPVTVGMVGAAWRVPAGEGKEETFLLMRDSSPVPSHTTAKCWGGLPRGGSA